MRTGRPLVGLFAALFLWPAGSASAERLSAGGGSQKARSEISASDDINVAALVGVNLKIPTRTTKTTNRTNTKRDNKRGASGNVARRASPARSTKGHDRLYTCDVVPGLTSLAHRCMIEPKAELKQQHRPTLPAATIGTVVNPGADVGLVKRR